MSEEHLKFPDDFDELEPLDSDPGNFEKVEEEAGAGPCGGPINVAVGHGEAVKDCKNVSPAEAKRIEDKARAKINSAIHRSCKNHGCKVKSINKPYRRVSCRKNHYTVVLGCRVTCTK